jgi:geranylgeranyl diphosphate synthase type II
MVLKKTCWLTTIHPTRMGTLIGSAGGMDIDGCIRFGFFLGSAFQIQDDLLNLEGDAKAYGKELGGDIREGKRTLMLIHMIEHATAGEMERLRRMLGQPREARSDEDVAWVRERMESYGSIDYARQVAHGLSGAAQHEFSELYGHLPESRDKRFLEALPIWVIERN